MSTPAIECGHFHCALCGATESGFRLTARDYITNETFDVVSCQRCTLSCVFPRPAMAELGRYYPREYYGDGGIRFTKPMESFVKWSRWRRSRRIRRGLSRGRILDIGCGRGWELAKLKALGWEVYGTERDEGAAEFAITHLGIDVRCSDLTECGFPREFFDVVTLWHVLEHLEDPVGTLREAHRVLRPGGKVFLATPNFGGFQAWLTGARWFHLDLPRHYYHFTPTSLARCLEAADFQVIERRHFSLEYDVFGLAQSLLNCLPLRPNLLFILLKQPGLAFKGPRELLAAVATAVLALPLLFGSLGISLLASLCRAGGSVECEARRA